MQRIFVAVAVLLSLSVDSLFAAEPTMVTLVNQIDPYSPSIVLNPGAEFQDDARSGAMIIGSTLR